MSLALEDLNLFTNIAFCVGAAAGDAASSALVVESRPKGKKTKTVTRTVLRKTSWTEEAGVPVKKVCIYIYLYTPF